MKRAILIAIASLSLGGCAGKSGGLSDALSYDSTPNKVTVDGTIWNVFEHPSNTSTGGRLMTAPTIGTAVGIGMVSGFTLGLANAEPAEGSHEAAARTRLDQSERGHCRITKGYELIRAQYEFTFECPSPPPAAPAGHQKQS